MAYTKPLLFVLSFIILSQHTLAQSSQASAPPFKESDVKIYTSDSNGSLTEVVTDKYSVETYFYGFFFKFNSDANLSVIKFKDNTLWSIGTDQKRPSKAYFDRSMGACLLEFDSLYKAYNISGNKPAFVMDMPINYFPPSEFKFYSHSTEFQGEKFDLRDYGHSYAFLLKPSDECDEIKHNGNELWKHDSNQVGSHYPIQFSITKVEKKAMVFFDAYKLQLTYRFENNKWEFKESKRLNPALEHDKFSFKTCKSDGSDESTNDDRYQKTLTDTKELTFVSNTPYTFCEVSYDGVSIWAHSTTPNKNRPSRIMSKLNESFVLVAFSDTDFAMYQFSNERWNVLVSNQVSAPAVPNPSDSQTASVPGASPSNSAVNSGSKSTSNLIGSTVYLD